MITAPGSGESHSATKPAANSTIHYNAGYVWMISSVAALGGLLFGYDWVVIGGAKPFYESYFRLTSETAIGWANSCALIGCLGGSILSGALSERFGRKKLLILAALLFAISSVLTGWAFSFAAFVAWRIAGGVAIGIASNVSPTYIAEVSPAPWRGRLVTLNQLTIVVGILAAQIMNWLIAERVSDSATQEMIRQSWNGQFGWRWMFTAVAAPSIAFLIGSILIPESPRWLARSGDETRVRHTLSRIGGACYSEVAMLEIRETLAGEAHGHAHASNGLRSLLTPNVRKILGVGIALAVLQQWSGINVIFNYAEDIYRSAGYGISGILFNIVITGTINLVFTLLALGLVDRVGRRALMLFGAAGIGISHTLLGFTYRAGIQGLPILLLTLCTIGFYALSLAPVTWVLISELFPNRIRSFGVSVAVSALWIASFILTFTFPLLQRAVGSAGTFWTYAGICFAGFLFVLAAVPETKGKSLEQIEHDLA